MGLVNPLCLHNNFVLLRPTYLVGDDRAWGGFGSHVCQCSFLSFLARHKPWLFLFSFCLLAISAWSVYRPGRTCPVDPQQAAQCAKADKWNKRVLMVSITIWCIGFIAAYLSLPLLNLFDA